MSYLLTLYIVTALISIVIAIFLVNLAKASGQARLSSSAKGTALGGPETEAMQKTLYEEVSTVMGRGARGEDAAKRITEKVGREVETRIQAKAQELKKQYESVLEVHSKSEEIAWKKYNQVLSDKKNTDAVIRSIAEGLLVVDSKGKVVMMNPAAERLLGVSKKEKIGKHITEDQKDEQLVSLMQETPDREGREIELAATQDETKKVLRASSAVIENENGQTIGMVSVLSDITKQKELDRLKSSFVASVSHELRTPLVAIDKSISLILGKTTGEINETQEKFLVIADRNIKRLSRLINDLLDLSKLEAGRMDLKRQPSSIDTVVTESLEALVNWSKTKSIELKKEVESGIPDVNFDPDRIIQVLTNLIGNAVKFTPNNGTITVRAALDNREGALKVSVTDTGIGVSPENLGRIFDKFYQVGERVPTDINGTGIGLALSKEIVELHGGKIWVESEKGAGTTFTFSLPLG